MEGSQTQVEYIALEVFKHDKPVTYHSLSRALNIHVNEAKQVLNEFYRKNEGKLIASWIITGYKNDKLTVQLVSNEGLSETMEIFAKINTIHIYCIYLNTSKLSNFDISLHELNYPSKLSDMDSYYKHGMIKGPEIIKIEPPLPQSTPLNKSPKKVSSVTPTAGEKLAKQVKSSGLTSGYVSRKNQKKADPIVPSKRLSLPANSGYVYKSRKLQVNQPKERVIISNSNEDEVMDEVDVQKKSENTTDLEKLFESDFSDEEPRERELDEKDNVQEQEQENNRLESVDIEMEDVEESTESKSGSIPDTIEEKEPEQEPEEVVQTIDEDGYIITARKKTTAKPQPRKPTKQRPTLIPNKKDGKKKQASLMSFFGQK
jgi:DNA polymerase delta subunit 3